MDIDDFEKQNAPRAKRSQLDPFRTQIFELKARGYVLRQIAEYLEQNGVSVSPQAVSKYIKSREQMEPASPQVTSTVTASKSNPVTPAATPASQPDLPAASATTQQNDVPDDPLDKAMDQTTREDIFNKYSRGSSSLKNKLGQKE